MDLSLNNLQWFICHKTQPNEIIYIWYKEDLVLNNLLGLICHKTQPYNSKLYIYIYIYIYYLQGLNYHKAKLNQTIRNKMKTLVGNFGGIMKIPQCRISDNS